ncbi:hypothetical protein J2786_001311 [Chryseobacterium vietnamense]|uniref:Uncharacterized protein n=2 Tax=Chryseobacterium TaxID=59732 RepID=A0A543EJL7_9FLAO|nr:hypothetical protein [Chryseobacterium vietnamense]TQM21770.1 hypothetical protein FB551_1464 [Chryseobacterium aquifrigidense]
MEIISKVKSFDFCHSDKARSLINNQTNEIIIFCHGNDVTKLK